MEEIETVVRQRHIGPPIVFRLAWYLAGGALTGSWVAGVFMDGPTWELAAISTAPLVVIGATSYWLQRRSGTSDAITVTPTHLRIHEGLDAHEFPHDGSSLVGKFDKDAARIRYFLVHSDGERHELPDWLKLTPKKWEELLADTDRACRETKQLDQARSNPVFRGIT